MMEHALKDRTDSGYREDLPEQQLGVRIFRRLISVYIFMLVLLPSGSIFGLNVKFFWFFLLLPASFWMYFQRHRATVFRTFLLLSVPATLLFWFLISQFYGFEPGYAVAQYKDLMVTIISCWFAWLLYQEGRSQTIAFIRVVIFSEVAASALKVGLLLYAYMHGIPVTQVVEWIRNVFGVSLMTLDFESMLGRIQFISDGLIPICIFAVLRFRPVLRFKSYVAIGILLLLLTSDIFSFSRYFWGFTVLAVFLGLLFGQKDFFQLSLIVVLSTIILASLPLLTTVISLRFSSTLVSASDQERTIQITALEDFFGSAPILGHGLGSYTHRVIRNDDAPYSYEDQLLALAGQVGIVGLLALGTLIIYYFRDLFLGRGGWSQSFGFGLMLLAWIAAGLFNPEVISSAASVSYASLAAMISLAKEGVEEPVSTEQTFC